MNTKLQKLRALSASEWWVLLVSFLLLPVVALSLKFRGYLRTRASLEKLLPRDIREHDAGKNINGPLITVPRMVSMAARYGPYRANCLKQVLVIWWLLARRGYRTEICFGVRDDQKIPFDAHAWVECNGVNLSDSEALQAQMLQFK